MDDWLNIFLMLDLVEVLFANAPYSFQPGYWLRSHGD